MLHLDEVNRYPLMPPKVDSATEMGITQEKIPSSFSPKVCRSQTLCEPGAAPGAGLSKHVENRERRSPLRRRWRSAAPPGS